jgi:hypothetical protein
MGASRDAGKPHLTATPPVAFPSLFCRLRRPSASQRVSASKSSLEKAYQG